MQRAFAAVLALGLSVTATATLVAQDDVDWCREWHGDRDRGWACEIREVTLAADRDLIAIDGNANGGITVEGWDRNEIFVRARVSAHARTDGDAQDLIEEVVLETGRVITSDGPRSGRRESWSVSFHIFVPRNSNLDLRTTNGGIAVEQVAGRVEFQATNGGVNLVELAGDIRGRTTNGGLDIWLSGTEWDGAGMDVRSTNGGVDIYVPEDYSARLETGTRNGGMTVDFPVTVQGRIGRELSVDLGHGGRTIRAVTTNGGVRIRRS